MWVLEYEYDLEADFLRFYGIKDYARMPSAKFFRLATRVFAYDGVMTARLTKMQEEGNSGSLTREQPKTYKEERFNLRKHGAQVATVQSTERSYLYDLLKEEN